MALITISLKLSTIYKFSPLPALSTLFYFMPVFFFEDSGQMRQGLGIAICVFSFRYIVERNLIMFLLCIYLALGFHKTSIVFLPAFWLVNIPMNSKRILWALVICLLLSPLEPYKLFGEMFTSLLPQDVSGGYDAYVNDSQFGVLVALGFSVTNANAKTLTFAGEQWVVKNGVAAPGPNNWSEDNAWVDSLGQLHLKISYLNGNRYIVTGKQIGRAYV